MIVVINKLSLAFLSFTPRYLRPKGYLGIEVGPRQSIHQRADLPEAWSAIWMGVMNGPWVC